MTPEERKKRIAELIKPKITEDERLDSRIETVEEYRWKEYAATVIYEVASEFGIDLTEDERFAILYACAVANYGGTQLKMIRKQMISSGSWALRKDKELKPTDFAHALDRASEKYNRR